VVIAFAVAWIGGLVGAAWLMDEGIVESFSTCCSDSLCPTVLELVHRLHDLPAAYAPADSLVFGVGQAVADLLRTAGAGDGRTFTSPAWLRYTMRHIMEHTAHHADPGVPLYHLPDAQKQLERVYRREMVRVIWSPAMFKRNAAHMPALRLRDAPLAGLRRHAADAIAVGTAGHGARNVASRFVNAVAPGTVR